MAMEVVLSAARATAQHVPYKGDAPAQQDLAGGQIAFWTRLIRSRGIRAG